jgi:RecA-family ATPase
MIAYRDHVTEILSHLDPNMPRAEWVRVGMAIQSEFPLEGLGIFDQWSKGGDTYKPADVRDTWKSFTKGGGIGFGTLVQMAKDSGWSPPETPPRTVPETQTIRTPTKDEWESAKPAPSNHPYLVQKGIQGSADLLKVRHSDGALLVPMWSKNGELSSVQAIAASGEKRFAKGLQAKGARLVLGDLHQGTERFFTAEGLATAWSVHQAMQEPVVVAFSAGWIPSLAKELKSAYARSECVIAADAGVAGEKAAKDAAAFGCKVAIPASGDWNDQAKAGADIRAEILHQITKPDPLDLETRLVDITADPIPPDYVVRQYLPRRQVTLLAGHGGSGKSTLALQIAAVMANGHIPFLGIGRRGRSLVVSAEDSGHTVGWRLQKIRDQMDLDQDRLTEELLVLDVTDDGTLFQEERDKDLGTMVGKVTGLYHRLDSFLGRHRTDLVIVDNASDCFAGNENDRQLVRGFIRELRRLAEKHDLAILLLAHVNKQSAARGKSSAEAYSGSTGWHNSVRSRIFLQVADDDPDRAVLLQQKNQFGALAAPVELTREDGIWIQQGQPSKQQADATALYRKIEEDRQAVEDGRVLAAIRERLEMGDDLSVQVNAQSSAFKTLETLGALPEGFQGKAKEARQRFNAALTRLEKRGALVREHYRKDYKDRARWAIPDPPVPAPDALADTGGNSPPVASEDPPVRPAEGALADALADQEKAATATLEASP